MTTAVRESFFICPECRQPLTVARECLCGFSLRESNGILHLMTEEDMADMRPFLQAFEEVRPTLLRPGLLRRLEDRAAYQPCLLPSSDGEYRSTREERTRKDTRAQPSVVGGIPDR